MKKEQEPKYDAIDGKIINRKTGIAIPDDEPIFILRAQDDLAWLTLDYYEVRCKDENHKKVIQQRMKQFKEFAENNPDRMKRADT